MTLQTEFEFRLPKGYIDSEGNLHRDGIMRLANARDEILPLEDPRVRRNEAYLLVILLSRVITRLVKMGLVTRTRSATNSREVVVRLTAKGAALLARVIPNAIALERTAIAGVPAKDLAVVRRSLRRMYENLAGLSSG